MQKLEITNPAGVKKTFELFYDKDVGEEAITDLRGFTRNFGLNITYERSPFQQGATAVAMRGETRALSFILHIIRKSAEEMIVRVNDIVEFLNPYLGEVTIVHDNNVRRRSINAINIGHTLIDYEDNRGYAVLALDFMADSALFEDEFFNSVDIGDDVGVFIVPVTIPFTLGSSVSTVIISNSGDYYNPVEIIFNGPLNDPKLIRDVYDNDDNIIQTDSLEFIGLAIDDFWSVRINTEQGREEATLISPTGVETNINRFLTVDSNYWQLFVGKNVIRFESATGNPVTEIKFKRKYITA